MFAKSDHFAVETGRNLLLTIGFINGWMRKTAANIHLVPDQSKALDAESVEIVVRGEPGEVDRDLRVRVRRLELATVSLIRELEHNAVCAVLERALLRRPFEQKLEVL